MSTIFSNIPEDKWVMSNDKAFAILDIYPASEGHTLVIPKREIETFFDEACVQLIKLLGIVNWMVEHDREGLQTIEDFRKLMMQISSTKSFLVSASLELTNK